MNDIYNNHLWAGQAADVIWKVIKSNSKMETYNVAGKDCISRFDLALKVAKAFNPNVRGIRELEVKIDDHKSQEKMQKLYAHKTNVLANKPTPKKSSFNLVK